MTCSQAANAVHGVGQNGRDDEWTNPKPMKFGRQTAWWEFLMEPERVLVGKALLSVAGHVLVFLPFDRSCVARRVKQNNLV